MVALSGEAAPKSQVKTPLIHPKWWGQTLWTYGFSVMLFARIREQRRKDAGGTRKDVT